jgi:hypothetical protein
MTQRPLAAREEKGERREEKEIALVQVTLIHVRGACSFSPLSFLLTPL